MSSWEAYKPFRIGMIALIAAIWLNDRTAAADRRSWRMLPDCAPWIAAGVAVVSMADGDRFGIFAAGGADCYWLREPGVALGPGPAGRPIRWRMSSRRSAWRRAAWLSAGADPDAIVPIYAPGLPLAMAWR